jgi:amidase
MHQPNRREFLTVGLSTGVAVAAFPAAVAGAQAKETAFELNELTIADLQERMQSGKETARSLASKYLARIEVFDRQGPALRSVIEINPDALALAAELDKERQQKGPRGPLHGIPILLKDNIDTADRMATTAGSLALIGARPPKDAFLVKRLRDAGAVILGKTNSANGPISAAATPRAAGAGAGA